MKYANDLQSECDILIDNIEQNTRNYILTETSPYNINYSPKSIQLSVGRESTGTSLIFDGNIVSSTISQPPDIGLHMKCLVGNYFKNNIVNRFQNGTVSIEKIAASIANDLKVQLSFQATNKNIPNYNYSGSALGQVTTLNNYGGINAFIDNGVLYVKDGRTPLNTGQITLITKDTGMLGIPETTEQGLKVTFLIDNKTKLGSAIDVISDINPSVNGRYVIYKLGFQITSRDIPFFYVAECQKIGDI